MKKLGFVKQSRGESTIEYGNAPFGMTLDHDINGLYEPRDVTKLCFCHHLKRHIMLDPQHVADLGALQCRRGLNKKRIAYFHFTKEDSEAAKKKVQMEISVLSAFWEGPQWMDVIDQ